MTQARPGGEPSAGSAPAHDQGQHADHLMLIDTAVRSSTADRVDAIVVPTARPAAELGTAIALAGELDAHLLVLCSRRATAAAARAEASGSGVRLTAIDVRPRLSPAGPATSASLAGTPFARDSDTSLKRNLALSVAHLAGWRKTLFMDDDVTRVPAAEVSAAAALLDTYDAVGLRNTGFPDNSVVCHANRDTKAEQSSFVGAGGLLVHTGRMRSFFPDVYNEDWFFLLGDERLVPVALSGTFHQRTFDPYADADRARQEEFGDCLAEGIYSLLDEGGRISDADTAFWRGFLVRRAQLIDRIARRLALLPADRVPRVAAALHASRATLARITPDHCVRFVQAWRDDRAAWRDHLDGLPSGVGVAQALHMLHLPA